MSMVLHNGALPVTWEELRAVPVPEATETFRPVPHAALLGLVGETLGVPRDSWEMAIKRGRNGDYGSILFAMAPLPPASPAQREDFAYLGESQIKPVVGVRNANNRKFTVSLAVGCHVLVCDNLAFTGELVLSRRHTGGIYRNLVRAMDEVPIKVHELATDQTVLIRRLRETAAEPWDVVEMLVAASDRGVFPSSGIIPLYREISRDRETYRSVWDCVQPITARLRGSNVFQLAGKTRRLMTIADRVATGHGALDTASAGS